MSFRLFGSNFHSMHYLCRHSCTGSRQCECQVQEVSFENIQFAVGRSTFCVRWVRRQVQCRMCTQALVCKRQRRCKWCRNAEPANVKSLRRASRSELWWGYSVLPKWQRWIRWGWCRWRGRRERQRKWARGANDDGRWEASGYHGLRIPIR